MWLQIIRLLISLPCTGSTGLVSAGSHFLYFSLEVTIRVTAVHWPVCWASFTLPAPKSLISTPFVFVHQSTLQVTGRRFIVSNFILDVNKTFGNQMWIWVFWSCRSVFLSPQFSVIFCWFSYITVKVGIPCVKVITLIKQHLWFKHTSTHKEALYIRRWAK